jgi:hypothetical protein
LSEIDNLVLTISILLITIDNLVLTISILVIAIGNLAIKIAAKLYPTNIPGISRGESWNINSRT